MAWRWNIVTFPAAFCMWVVNMSWGCIWPKSATWGDDWGVSEAIQMFSCLFGPVLGEQESSTCRITRVTEVDWASNWGDIDLLDTLDAMANKTLHESALRISSLFWGANKNANNQQYHVGLKLELVNFMRAVIYLDVSLNRQVLFIRFQLRLNLQISGSEFLEFLVRRPICLQPRWSNSGKQGREIKGLS
jgi:hypothetical protein